MPHRKSSKFSNILPPSVSKPTFPATVTAPNLSNNLNNYQINLPAFPDQVLNSVPPKQINLNLPPITNPIINVQIPPPLTVPPPNVIPNNPNFNNQNNVHYPSYNEVMPLNNTYLPPPNPIFNLGNTAVPPPILNDRIPHLPPPEMIPHIPLHAIPEPKPIDMISIPPPKPLDTIAIPPPKPLDAITIPPPKPMNLHTIPPPLPICLTQIPKPKELDLHSIPHPPSSGMKQVFLSIVSLYMTRDLFRAFANGGRYPHPPSNLYIYELSLKIIECMFKLRARLLISVV